MIVNFSTTKTQNNPKVSFKGKDGCIRYFETHVVKDFYQGREKEFEVEKEVLSFLTNEGFPFAPKFIKAEGHSVDMERIFGQNLLDFLPQATKEQILWVKEQTLKAANALAKMGIFHNDLNRANVVVVRDSNNSLSKIVVLDFADAKKVKSLDTAQLADDMVYKKHLFPILDEILSTKH